MEVQMKNLFLVLKKFVFISIFLCINFVVSASELPEGRFLVLSGRIMSPERPAAPKDCDKVLSLTIAKANKVTLSERYFGKCNLPQLNPHTRVYQLKIEGQFTCGSTYISGLWGKAPYITLNDYRLGSVQCFVPSTDLPFPVVSDISIEEMWDGNEFSQFLSLECSNCTSAKYLMSSLQLGASYP
jgi:hypothetical protein